MNHEAIVPIFFSMSSWVRSQENSRRKLDPDGLDQGVRIIQYTFLNYLLYKAKSFFLPPFKLTKEEIELASAPLAILFFFFEVTLATTAIL